MWWWIEEIKGGDYSIASLIKARNLQREDDDIKKHNDGNLLAYCSGSAVEIPSTLEPYLTVFAAWDFTYNCLDASKETTFAAAFLTP